MEKPTAEVDNLKWFSEFLETTSVDEIFLKFSKKEKDNLDELEFKAYMNWVYSKLSFAEPSEAEIGSTFKDIDTNHNGSIDKSELKPFARRLLKYAGLVMKPKVKRAFTKAEISKAEENILEMQQLLENEEELNGFVDEVFGDCEENIDLDKLENLLLDLCHTMNIPAATPDDVKRLFEQTDTNHNGKIEKEELKPFIVQLINSSILENTSFIDAAKTA